MSNVLGHNRPLPWVRYETTHDDIVVEEGELQVKSAARVLLNGSTTRNGEALDDAVIIEGVVSAMSSVREVLSLFLKDEAGSITEISFRSARP